MGFESEYGLWVRWVDVDAILTDAECQDVIAALEIQEWSGLTKDDIRMLDSAILAARTTSASTKNSNG
jgi:hypothetical protein